MVNPMQHEVQRQENWFIRQKFVDVEEEAMHPVFQQRPDQVSEQETRDRFAKCVKCQSRCEGEGKERAGHECGYRHRELKH